MLIMLSTNDSLNTILKWLQHLFAIPFDRWHRITVDQANCMPMDETCRVKNGLIGMLIGCIEFLVIYGAVAVLTATIVWSLVKVIFSRPCQHNCGRKTISKSRRSFGGRCELGKHCCVECWQEHDKMIRQERSEERRLRRLQREETRALQRERRKAARAHILNSAPEVRCVFDGLIMKPKFLKGGRGAIIFTCSGCKSQFNPGPQHQQTVA